MSKDDVDKEDVDKHTCTHTHSTHTHAHTCTRVHTCMHAHTRAHTHTHTLECYSTIKNGILLFETMWIDLQSIILSERSQTERQTLF